MEKQVTISIPLSEEELDEYFDEIEDCSFLIDFDKCQYTGKKMLNYIYNSGMFCELKLSSYDDKLEELMVEYICFDRQVSIPVLNDLWNIVLIRHLTGAQEGDKELLTFVDSFIEKHMDIIEELVVLLNSVMTQMLQLLNKEDGVIEGAEKRQLKKISLNFITLRLGTDFWSVMAEVHKCEKAYNYNVLSDFCYEGKRLSSIMMNEFNPFSVMSLMLAQGEESADAENNTDK